MAKAGMRRPNVEEPHGDEANGEKQRFSKNEVPPVPEIQGRLLASFTEFFTSFYSVAIITDVAFIKAQAGEPTFKPKS